MKKVLIIFIIFLIYFNVSVFAGVNFYDNTTKQLEDKYNPQKDYFDYSVILTEFPKNYYYTTVKIKKSKERILIITDKINSDKTANDGLFYYFAQNGFVYPLGYLASEKPLSQSKNYIYLSDGCQIKIYQ